MPSALVPDVTRVGAPIPQWDNEDTVMWVKVSDPPPLLQERGYSSLSVPQHYWRGGIFTRYNSTGWDIDQSGGQQTAFGFPAEIPAGRYSLNQEFEITVPHGDSLFAVNMPVRSSDGATLRFISPDGNAVLKGAVSKYDVTSWVTNATAGQLMADTTDYPLDVSLMYLQLPDSLPQRVRDLAAGRLVVAHQTRHDRQTRRIGRCPSSGAERIAVQVEQGGGIGGPGGKQGVVQLVEHAG